MTREEEAIAIIENEKECVNRANKNDYCNRDCYNCELVKTDTEILTALDMAIHALEMQKKLAEFGGMDICDWVEDYDIEDNNISEYEYEASVNDFLIDEEEEYHDR